MFRRIALFLATNLAVIALLTTSLHLVGIEPYLRANGINVTALLAFAAVFGFGGALISLAMSKWMAIHSVGAHVIDQPATPAEQWLVSTVQRLAEQADIGMPDVAIYESPDVNAFATGMNRHHALVAVSTGLLHNMTEDEIEAVLAHEVSHIANGDMVTLTLIQGVVNTFVIFLSRIIGAIVDKAIFRTERGYGPGYFITVIVSELLLGLVATVIVIWFSRQREFRADAGGARLAGRDKMIAALQRLQHVHADPLPSELAAFGIAGGFARGIRRLFMSHPPLEERITALQHATYA
ncbi:MAG: protease HtpX [Gammaproteobacteria bacterium]|nr:MAG: protease HtpX [Gammaproteobacteria bacterium]